KITGTSSQKDISLLSADTMTGSSFKVQIWVDKENSQLLKITLEEPSNNGKQHPATWTMMISDYNADVTVEAPE
ncbi:MAG: LppX_LprAFG lipoprotein, partial [Thermomicrobiales bacterium]